MRSQARRLRCVFAPPCLVAILLPAGCGTSQVPDGGHINVTIPKEQAEKQNEAYKNYSKQNKKLQPASKQGDAYRNYSRGGQSGRPPG